MTIAGNGQQKEAVVGNERVDNCMVGNGKSEKWTTEHGADNGAGRGRNSGEGKQVLAMRAEGQRLVMGSKRGRRPGW